MLVSRRFCLALPLVAIGEVARADLYTPPVGSAERRAIMDAARVPIQREIGRPLVFVVDVLNSDGTWAYLQAVPHNHDGTPMDWSQTMLARDWANGWMSDIAMVLLRRDGKGWQVEDWVMGPTDVYWLTWADQYGFPERFFTN